MTQCNSDTHYAELGSHPQIQTADVPHCTCTPDIPRAWEALMSGARDEDHVLPPFTASLYKLQWFLEHWAMNQGQRNIDFTI